MTKIEARLHAAGSRFRAAHDTPPRADITDLVATYSLDLTAARPSAPRRRRLLPLLAAAVIAAVGGAAAITATQWGNHRGGTGGYSGWVRTSNNGVTFEHPSAWRFYPFTVGGSTVSITGYLSTDAVHDPCATATTSAGGTIQSCGSPINHLGLGGVLVTLGGADGRHPPATSTAANSTVAGRPAIITRGSATDSCHTLGGIYQIHLLVLPDLTGKYGQIQMTGCFAGADTTTAQNTFEQLIRTISYTAK